MGEAGGQVRERSEKNAVRGMTGEFDGLGMVLWVSRDQAELLLPPNPDLVPANNAVLRPPVRGKVGVWAKTDTTSYFKDYVVSPK
jgi:hypothetical protein